MAQVGFHVLCFVLFYPPPHTLYISGIQLLFQFIRTIASRQFHGIICLGFTSWFHNRGSSNLTTALASNCSWQRPIKFHRCQIDNRSQIFNLSLMGKTWPSDQGVQIRTWPMSDPNCFTIDSKQAVEKDASENRFSSREFHAIDVCAFYYLFIVYK